MGIFANLQNLRQYFHYLLVSLSNNDNFISTERIKMKENNNIS